MKVQTDALRDSSDALRRVWQTLERADETIQSAARALSGESVGEKFQPSLSLRRCVTENLWNEVLELQLKLDRIADLYERYEERITDRAEADELPSLVLTPGPMLDMHIVGPGGRLIDSIRIPDLINVSGESSDFVGW